MHNRILSLNIFCTLQYITAKIEQSLYQLGYCICWMSLTSNHSRSKVLLLVSIIPTSSQGHPASHPIHSRRSFNGCKVDSVKGWPVPHLSISRSVSVLTLYTFMVRTRTLTLLYTIVGLINLSGLKKQPFPLEK